MTKWVIGLLLVLGAALVVGSVVLRVQSGGRYEVKTTDLVFLVVPLLVVALATGRVKGLDLFGVKADLSEFWRDAARDQISAQVVKAKPATVADSVESPERGSKAELGQLERLVARGVDALEFELGYGGYDGPAIQEYFETLSTRSDLRVIVVVEPGGRLFGIYDAPDLIASLRSAGVLGYNRLKDLLNSEGQSSRAALTKLPGFVPGEAAVRRGTSKREALARMQARDTDLLPVVDEPGKFVGTVGRTKLTAGMILAITDRLEGREQAMTEDTD